MDYLAAYNKGKRARHYNHIATTVYEARAIGPLSHDFEHAIIEGLKGFDMARTMKREFSGCLRNCLNEVRKEAAVGNLKDYVLSTVDLTACEAVIKCVYNHLARPGKLDTKKQSHVATTKILHWLFPDLFLIVDSNVACAFRIHFGVTGYSPENYIVCLRKAQNEICLYGPEQFRKLEPGTPEARIFDKIAFAVGSGATANI